MARHVAKGLMSPSSSAEMDTSVLFEKYTVEEIREIEKKTRQDIEKKKEDLRQMVGERYRDLIEAADTITEMKRSTEKVTVSIAKMQDLCTRLKQSCSSVSHKFSTTTPSVKDLKTAEQNQVYSTAVNLKILMDMPEKIWSSLDGGRYLLSTRLYLLSRHIYAVVQLDTRSARIASHFPVLARQWTSISHFRSTILQTCRARLKDVNISTTAVCECLCSILLIEDYTTEQLFQEFLTTRLEAIRQLFESDNTDISVRLQLCSVVSLIVTTVHQIHAIFYQQQQQSASGATGSDTNKSLIAVQSNLLVTMLGHVTATDQSGAILSTEELNSPSYKFLSRPVNDFRPTLKQPPTAIPASVLRDSCAQYISKCKSVVQGGLSKLLSYITAVKGLATIRDEIWTTLRLDERMITWPVVCEQVFGQTLSVWDEFLRQLFLQRVQSLVGDQFDGTFQSCRSQIGKLLADLANMEDKSLQCERDVLSYIWTEGPHDIPTNMAWLPVGQKTLSEGGSLIMKARVYTPAVQSLCRGIDQKTKSLLDDIRYYIQPSPSSSSTPQTSLLIYGGEMNPLGGESLTHTPAPPFDQYADSSAVQEYVQTSCEDCFAKLLSHLSQLLTTAKQQLVTSSSSGSTTVAAAVADIERNNLIIIDRILVLGRFSGAICELSSNLRLCMSNQLCEDKSTAVAALTSPSVKKPMAGKVQLTKMAENPRWMKLRESLIAFRNQACRVWTEYTSDRLTEQFQIQLCDSSAQAILLSSTQWDCIEIEEETESGTRVKSTIRVPMQASWYVQIMLYRLCEEINRIGGQAIQWSSIHHLVESMLFGIVTSYETLLRNDDKIPSGHPTPPSAKGGEKNSAWVVGNTVGGGLKGGAGGAVLSRCQNRAVQLLFDLKFLANLLLHKDDTETCRLLQTRIQKVVEHLESRIDPFDLDVFYPHLQNHLHRQTARSEVLYGSLITDRHSSYSLTLPPSSSSSSSAGAGGQEQHNILPLSASQQRFPLLPLSMQNRSTTTNIQPIVQPPKPKTVVPASMQHLSVSGAGGPVSSGSSSAGLSTVAPPRVNSTSFLEQMSTMWFSGSAR